MRGKVQLVIFAGVIHGITPAYAGKRQTRAPCGLYGRDHPRLCGEKFGFEVESEETTGSPPPMRGKGDYKKEEWNAFRITPAYAGKRPVVIGHRQTHADHPRLCGEKQQR